MARWLSFLIGSLIILSPLAARTESMIPPFCTCNDECKHKWPYSGICAYSYNGQKHCGYWNQGPGIPCTDGGPIAKPDAPPKSCTCNGDCSGWGTSYGFCNKTALGTYCTGFGPGIVCDAGVPSIDVVTTVPCTCNDQCKGGATYAPFCAKTPAGLRCSNWGPGIPCDARVPAEGDPRPPVCRCNDSCSGAARYCNPVSGTLRCTETPPGLRCDAGPPRTDDRFFASCRCDSDCVGSSFGPFCRNGECADFGPGRPCGGDDVRPPYDEPAQAMSRGCSFSVAGASRSGAPTLLLIGLALVGLIARRRAR